MGTVKEAALSSLRAGERDLLIVVALVPPPVSLDLLVGFSGRSPVTVLKDLESLVTQRLLRLDRSAGPGHYALRDSGDAEAILSRSPKEIVVRLTGSLIDHVEMHTSDNLVKSLLMTNIYKRSGTVCRDMGYVLRAADHCLDTGDLEAAAADYLFILDHFADSSDRPNEPRIYIDAALGLVSAHGHRIPMDRQGSILQQAQAFAQQANDPERLCRVSLLMAQVAKTEGKYDDAARLNEEAWNLALSLNSEKLLREAALFTSDFLFWQGRISDAVERYENVVGDMEELPAEESTLQACATLGWCYGICGQTARGVSLIEAVQQKAIKRKFSRIIPYTNLMSTLTLLDARRLREAEACLDDIFRNPKEDLGNYILWGGYAAKAFILYSHGDLEGCFAYQKKAYAKSKEFGWFHHRGPWNFEYMEALEEVGLIHQEMNYDSELERLSRWPDIYMKGVGLRYRAKRMLKTGAAERAVSEALEKSAGYLSEAGATVELAHTQVLLARLRLRAGKEEQARGLLRKAWNVISAVNPDLFPDELRPYLEEERKEDFLIRTLLDVSDAIGTVRRRSRLLERIINLSLRLTGAGRGGVFLFDEQENLRLAASRNLDPSIVDSEDFAASRKMIRDAVRTGREHIRGENGDGKNVEKGGRAEWQVAYPLLLRERGLGVIYLDSSLLGVSPSGECLSALKVIASQVAVALDNAQAYDEIARLKERLEDETRFYRMELEAVPRSRRIVGNSPGIRQVLAQIKKVGATDSSVLIFGETGVGKELVARAIYRIGSRREGPFIPVNSASLDPGLIASELFGHEKGAFTGASRLRRGRFELADGGTLFLDDIDTLSLEIQTKILRTLQEKEFERVGGDRTIHSDFRLLAATNQNLEALVASRKFRADLYYRLKVFPILIPPLRDRKEDIPLLAVHFLDHFNAQFGKSIRGLRNHQIEALQRYPWPGNVRELKHIMERAAILSDGRNFPVPDLFPGEGTGESEGRTLTLRQVERNYILSVLKRCEWKVSGKGGAAEILDMKPTTLYARIRKLGLQKNVSYEPEPGGGVG